MVGLMKLQNCPSNYSANLILRKVTDEDLYGVWNIAVFKDSALTRGPIKENYGLDQGSFYEEYEQSRVAMHIRSVDVNEFTAADINLWVDYLLH